MKKCVAKLREKLSVLFSSNTKICFLNFIKVFDENSKIVNQSKFNITKNIKIFS
jgi:hypothetical protein